MLLLLFISSILIRFLSGSDELLLLRRRIKTDAELLWLHIVAVAVDDGLLVVLFLVSIGATDTLSSLMLLSAAFNRLLTKPDMIFNGFMVLLDIV